MAEKQPLIDKVADFVHWQWSHWMKYMFTKTETDYLENIDKVQFILPHDEARWKRQMQESYYELSQDEKKSDIEIARQIIANWKYDPYTGKRIHHSPCVDCGKPVCYDCGRCHIMHCDAEQLCT